MRTDNPIPRDGNSTHYLDGTGALTTPAGTAPPVTTKGDLFGFTTVAARLPVGADGSILVADSATASGLMYETAQYRMMSVSKIVQGTVSYTVPDDTRAIYVTCVGAGGGGGGVATAAVSAAVAGGGGGGASSGVLIIAPKLTAFTVSVGAGGLAGTNAGGTGGTGGDTSFDTGPNLALAKGGVGGVGETAGTAAAIVSGGVGGAAASGIGTILLDGQPGQVAQRITGLIGYSGGGGNGVGSDGGGGGIGQAAAAAGANGGLYGGGGGGGLVLNGSAAVTGGVGANGVIIVWEFA